MVHRYRLGLAVISMVVASYFVRCQTDFEFARDHAIDAGTQLCPAFGRLRSFDFCEKWACFSSTHDIKNRSLVERNRNTIVPESIHEMAQVLISIFARDIEHAGAWAELYTGAKTRNEDCAQNMFWRLGNHLAATRGAKLLREPNIGKAEPDFLLTNGKEDAIIELKLTKHRRIRHARAQLRKYLNILPRATGFLVVIHVKDRGTEALRGAFLKAEEANRAADQRIESLLIDATPKESPAESI